MTAKAWAVCRSRRGLGGALGLLALLACTAAPKPLHAQGEPAAPSQKSFEGQTTQEYNRRLEELRRMLEPNLPATRPDEYRIGPEDLLDIAVFEAPELNRSERVAASGEISLPLLGGVRAAGLTPRELESVLEELLRRTYMKDPHVGVFVREMQSHPVSVFGAVKKPGVFQIRAAKTLVEMLSMAEGLAEDAGDTVIVMRGAGFRGLAPPEEESARPNGSAPPSEKLEAAGSAIALDSEGPGTIGVDLKRLLESGNPTWNVLVYPGDVVKVTRAGIVYVVGEVKKPGGYLLKSNENISVLQAIALAEGLTRTSAKGQARIIRTEEGTGRRIETPLDLGKILAGKAPDPVLRPKDIVFVPNSAARSAFYRGAEAAVNTITGIIVFRR